MALRRFLGFSDGELMRSDSKPCSRLMRHTAGVFSVGGALGFWILCRLHYGPRVNVPRSLRWAGTGAITVSASTALLIVQTSVFQIDDYKSSLLFDSVGRFCTISSLTFLYVSVPYQDSG
ncbi:hypothetical protein Tco_0659913 [Tanacetum coccineum]